MCSWHSKLMPRMGFPIICKRWAGTLGNQTALPVCGGFSAPGSGYVLSIYSMAIWGNTFHFSKFCTHPDYVRSLVYSLVLLAVNGDKTKLRRPLRESAGPKVVIPGIHEATHALHGKFLTQPRCLFSVTAVVY